MKPNERKETLLAAKENIEMESLSFHETREVLPTQELEEDHCAYQNLEHPLVVICEEEPILEVEAQQDGVQKSKPQPNMVTPSSESANCGSRPPPLVFMEDIEIEMEVLPHLTKSKAQLVGLITPTFSCKASRMKWKPLTPQQSGLVVKDVFCLPRGLYVEGEIGRNTAPQGKAQAALSAMGLTARITIDRAWSAKQMASRLAALFQGRVAKEAGQCFSFSYLKCMQQVLFVPATPVEGWTGAQVLRISGPGALYILSHHDHLQAATAPGCVDVACGPETP
ncbi:uncharacterized protein [Syngnathus scovelli]|uniref:uncharacterized protein n=1 Tax=Syngnathus scovelli TaxID=161590 RepID=UPI00211052FF|nr:uncharacterized protein LOC125976123 [Syngnathus scovelli]